MEWEVWRVMPNILRVLSLFTIAISITLFIKRKSQVHQFIKISTILSLVASVALFIVILLNKELFHWNYDIATGKPVDHYSTYYFCIVNTICTSVISIVNIVVVAVRRRKKV